MSAVAVNDPTAKSTSKKKRKGKKKANGKGKEDSEVAEVNGAKNEAGDDPEGDGDEDEGSRSPVKGAIPLHLQTEDSLHMPSSPPEPASPADDPVESEIPTRNGSTAEPYVQEGPTPSEITKDPDDDALPTQPADPPSDTTTRLDSLEHEREALRFEVTQLRQSLEQIQERHSEEISAVREELSESQQSKDHAETQYRNLLSKVNTIRSQLGERLKADAEELGQARGQIEELEANRDILKEENDGFQSSLSKFSAQLSSQASEIDTLRSRTSLSTSNWAKERDDLITREAYAREEFEAAKQAMQDWEVLAMEERSLREALTEKAGELEEQLGGQQEAYERAKSEADTQGSTVEGLQRALQEIQEARRRELRELVENSQAQLAELRKQAQAAEATASATATELEAARKDLERALPFEREVKEKNLLIGKLRHEAVILNDHLTKALRFLRRGKPEDNVDRQIVTNHFLHFLCLDRSDAKKFQVLQLIAALLGWNDEQREQAGLSRPGATSSTGSLRIPLSPFHRTPSTPALTGANMDFMTQSPGGAGRESLAELWSDFLEREAEAGGGGNRSRSVVDSGGRAVSGTGGLMSPTERSSPEVKRKEGSSICGSGGGGAG